MTSLAQSVIARAIKQRDLMQAMNEQSRTITARVTSRDRAVSAEVDGLGSLTGLWLGPPASRLDPDTLATLIVDTAHAAARVAAERYNFLLREFMARMEELQRAPLARSDGTVIEPR
ncbi:YbaB/EbfC family nucleoid-associated protein [Mycobacterium camsae]|uniref:YbaB/EbfC family nucleoid-associated protein n=1 Tax=Mycobacterium gordonae TaxID=1778 RepID=UPI001981620C|nr:YbaB/EbfC family nucleoid-associated protein [Mycobacterium gordonae]